MKTLKITFLLAAVVVLTLSGHSSDAIADSNEPTFKEYNQKDLAGIDKRKKRLESQG